MKRKWFLLTIIAVVLSLTAPFVFANSDSNSRLYTVLKRGKLIVGTSSEAPPFGFINSKGQLVGFDVDIAKLIAKSMFGSSKGHIEFVKQPFSSRWANIKSGRVDFGIQETTIYPDRLLNVNFTQAVQNSAVVIVVRNDSGITTTSQLNDSKYAVANLTAPIEAEISERLFPKAKRLTFNNTAEEFTALMSKRVEAMTIDLPIAEYYSAQHPGKITVLKQWGTPPTNNAIFMRMNDFQWWYYLNTMVGEMRGGSLFNAYSKIYKKWFGVAPININPSVAH